jgi:hypothetical protein
MKIQLTNAEIIVILTSILTVLITISGWFVTLQNQKKLISSQLEADNKKLLLELKTKNNIEYLNQIESWREEGEKIAQLVDSTPDTKLLKRFRLWQGDYSTIRKKAKILNSDPLIDPPSKLGFWLNRERMYTSWQIEMGFGFENRSGIDDSIEFMNQQIHIHAEVEFYLEIVRSNIYGYEKPNRDDFKVAQLVELIEDEDN